jgi:hypothetical protein
VIQQLLVDCLDLLAQIILPGLLGFLMALGEDQACKESDIVGVDVELALFKEVHHGVGVDLHVLTGALQMSHGLSGGEERTEPVQLLVETVDDGQVEIVHPLEHLLPDLRVCFLSL